MDYNLISIIIDIILTIVTGVMAYATFKMANSTKKSVEEMKISREDANSAEVVMYFEINAHRMYLIIENVGKTIAKDVKIIFEPELINSHGETFSELKEISYLPPNYKVRTFFDMTHSYYDKYKKFPCTKFMITYQNFYKKLVERKYESDLNYFNDVYFLNSESETLEMSLYKINKEFHKTNKQLGKLIKKDESN